ncbi:MAG: polysaccharide deacetylase family protein [Planctomycetaceae bacterium]
MVHKQYRLSRRSWLTGVTAASAAACLPRAWAAPAPRRAQIVITFDLEMSRHYPQRGMMEWDFRKGDLDQPTKDYAVEAARIAKERGGLIHFFCVGRVLEQPDVEWLKHLSATGHPIGNHTYDHVNVLAKQAVETQFRFQRSPWLVEGKTAPQIIAENVKLTTVALQERCGIKVDGFRTPGGFATGLDGREDVQQILLDQGFTWISSKYPAHKAGEPMVDPGPEVFADIIRAHSAAQPYVYPTGLIELPMNPISDVGAFRTNYWKRPFFLQAIREGIDWAITNQASYDFLCHPSCMLVEDPQFEVVQQICGHVARAGDKAEIVGLSAIAERVRV